MCAADELGRHDAGCDGDEGHQGGICGMKRRIPSPPPWVIFAAAGGFLAGMLVMAALFVIFPTGPLASGEADTATLGRAATNSGDRPSVEIRPTAKETPSAVV